MGIDKVGIDEVGRYHLVGRYRLAMHEGVYIMTVVAQLHIMTVVVQLHIMTVVVQLHSRGRQGNCSRHSQTFQVNRRLSPAVM